ncbi:MAG: shikimate dehydrogenase family protein [Mangrovibacterium sp.]
MKTFGLIGYRLGHSFSKSYFNRKFTLNNIDDCVFENFELDTIADFPQLISEEPSLVGLNCTIPYKQEVMCYLDEIDAVARQIGAVNTIKIIRGEKLRLVGYNTDSYGFEMSLKPLLCSFHDKALILGTGGAAKAVKYVLEKLNINVVLVSRASAKSHGVLSYEDLTEEVIHARKLIVNTTPCGTTPNVDECPEIPYEYLGSEHCLYDLIYNPEETKFLKKGRERGATIKNGLEMLHLQAEKAWEIWHE